MRARGGDRRLRGWAVHAHRTLARMPGEAATRRRVAAARRTMAAARREGVSEAGHVVGVVCVPRRPPPQGAPTHTSPPFVFAAPVWGRHPSRREAAAAPSPGGGEPDHRRLDCESHENAPRPYIKISRLSLSPTSRTETTHLTTHTHTHSNHTHTPVVGSAAHIWSRDERRQRRRGAVGGCSPPHHSHDSQRKPPPRAPSQLPLLQGRVRVHVCVCARARASRTYESQSETGSFFGRLGHSSSGGGSAGAPPAAALLLLLLPPVLPPWCTLKPKTRGT